MDQYDASPEMKKLYEIKQKQRTAAKAYFRDLVYNPYRPVNDGVPFDPALFRYNAMSAYHLECFKPSPKTFLTYFIAMSPIVIFYFYVSHKKKKEEELLRSGVIRYEDRAFKHFY